MNNEIVSYITADEIRALVLIILITWGGTEAAKRSARTFFSQAVGQWSPRTIAFLIGFFTSYYIWPVESTLPGWQVGLGVGAGWPAVYALVVSIIRSKWPEAADGITGRVKKRDNNHPPDPPSDEG